MRKKACVNSNPGRKVNENGQLLRMANGSGKKEKVPNPFPIRTSGPILPCNLKYSPPTFGGLFDTERLNQGGWGEECSPAGNPGFGLHPERRLKDVEVLPSNFCITA
jgi:hypothetical protein